MTIQDKIRDEKLQYDSNREKICINIISMNILLVKKYCHLINRK